MGFRSLASKLLQLGMRTSSMEIHAINTKFLGRECHELELCHVVYLNLKASRTRFLNWETHQHSSSLSCTGGSAAARALLSYFHCGLCLRICMRFYLERNQDLPSGQLTSSGRGPGQSAGRGRRREEGQMEAGVMAAKPNLPALLSCPLLSWRRP